MCATRQTSAAGADAWRGEEHLPMGEKQALQPAGRWSGACNRWASQRTAGAPAARVPEALSPYVAKAPHSAHRSARVPRTFCHRWSAVGLLEDQSEARSQVYRVGDLNLYGWDRKRSGCRSIPQWLSSAAIRKVESCRPSREPERTLRCDPDSLTRSPAFECGDLVAGETRHARACDRGAARAVA